MIIEEREVWLKDGEKQILRSPMATDAALLLQNLAKGFKRLELTVRTFNAAGIALYEKVGFKRVGHLHGVALIDGELYDEYQYERMLR